MRVACLVVAMLVTCELLARADSIVLANGTRHAEVEVLQARWDAVQFKVGKATAQNAKGEDVESITRNSPHLQGARSALEAGDYKKAASELQALNAAAKDWEKAEAEYLTGIAYLRAGDAKKAEESFKAYLEKHKEGKDWWVPAATYNLGESLLMRKQPGTAETYFKELEQYGGQWVLRSKLGQGKAILDSKGKSGALQARTLLNEVARAAGSKLLSLKQEAQVERVRTFIVAEQYDEALNQLGEAFFNAPKPGELAYSAERALATLLMAQAYLGRGGKENLERAEIWLLKVAALYRQHAGVYAQACGLLAEVYAKLGKNDRAEEWKKRKPADAQGK